MNDWHLSEEVRARGRVGVARAREMMRRARAGEALPEPVDDDDDVDGVATVDDPWSEWKDLQ